MGIFKKIFKGIGKVFKKIGRAIKKGFKKFGKFMGKIGIVGQLAMMFILPGIGGALMKGLGGMAGKMASLTGKFAGLQGSALGSVVKGVGTVLKSAHGFVQTGVNAFKTVTSGIMEFGKTALNKIPNIDISGAKANFFGSDSVMEGIKMDAGNIMNPFRDNITLSKDMTLDKLSSSTGLSVENLQKLNPNTVLNEKTFGNLANTGQNLNLDFSKISPNIEAIQANAQATVAGFNPAADPLDFEDILKVPETGYKPGELNLNFNPTGEGLPDLTGGALDASQAVLDQSQTTLAAYKPMPTVADVDYSGLSYEKATQSLLSPVEEIVGKPLDFTDPSQYGMPSQPQYAYGTTDFERGLLNTGKVTDVAGVAGEAAKPSLFDRGMAGVNKSINAAIDDPISVGLPMLQSVAKTFATPEEIEVSGGGRGYIADVLPQFDFTAVDMTPVLNAGNYGAGAISMDFLNQGMMYQSPTMAFPGAVGYGR